jgi:hypothetical protein
MNVPAGGARAAIAVAMIGPTPGIVISRLARRRVTLSIKIFCASGPVTCFHFYQRAVASSPWLPVETRRRVAQGFNDSLVDKFAGSVLCDFGC